MHSPATATPTPRPGVAFLWAVGAAMAAVACGPNAALYDPSPAILTARAPDSFLVEMVTSEGGLVVKMRRHWSPAGVDRVHTLLTNDFYAGARIYRVVDGFVAQWGYSGDPALVDNERLDHLMSGGVEGYPPVGEIVDGLEVVDGFYGAYRDRTPSQDSIRILGNDYLRREYPQLDSIVSTRVVTSWPGG